MSKTKRDRYGWIDNKRQKATVKIGDSFTNNKGEAYKVYDYVDSNRIGVVFDSSRFKRSASVSQIKSGSLSNSRIIQVGDTIKTSKGDVKLLGKYGNESFVLIRGKVAIAKRLPRRQIFGLVPTIAIVDHCDASAMQIIKIKDYTKRQSDERGFATCD